MRHLPVFIPLIFFLGALLIAFIPRRRTGLPHAVAVASSLGGFALSIFGLGNVILNGPMRYHLGGWQPPIGIELSLDALSAFMCVVVTFVALLVLIHSKRVAANEHREKAVPFYSATMLLLGGFLGIAVTADLFNLYVFLEISSLASYALVAIGDKRAPVSAFRYLILGTVGASFYLLGLGFIFMVTGSLNMADVAAILPQITTTPPVLIGVILMVIGIGVKMALFPLHGWLPDAYTYASSTSTALIAPIGTKVAAYVLIRLLFFVFEKDLVTIEIPVLKTIGYLGAAGIIAGSILAIAQHDLKRMLAYSSVAQISYIALGIGLGSTLGLIGAILHILNHAFMKACLFLVSANFLTKLGHTEIPRLDNSVRLKMPWTSAAFALAAISMIGLPPTAGFFSKWYLVIGSFEQSNWIFITVILVSSLLNAVYFFRVLEKIYLRSGEQKAEEKETAVASTEAPPSMLYPALILAAGLLVLGLGNVFIVDHVIKLMIPPNL